MIHKKEAKEWARATMKGLWTSPMFPFTQDFKLDEAGMRHNVEYIIQSKADGIGFGFSEPWACSLAERKRAMEVSIDAIKRRVPTYLHCTDHSVEETLNLVRHAQDVGADAVMIWPPYEWAKTQQMVIDYYEYVASKVDIAIILYNTWHSGIVMTPETIAHLAKIPNVCAVKDAINDVAHTVRCIELCGDQLVFSTGVEEHLLAVTLHFNVQLLLGSTSVFLLQTPHCQPIKEYFDLARTGKAAEASRKYYEMQPLRNVWNGIYQSLWNKKGALHPLPLIKYWMELNGMRAGPVRPPMHNLTEQDKAEFRERLEASGWMERLHPQRQKKAS
ncbi:MAG: dihydrodipicolinate synthase family protein [Betaproteobacteria bacterium]|nr:dihydrodipicolinate synthase family protein [Betaproteobacteria bacterium]